MKHKLAIVLPSARGGGAERVLLNLLQTFKRDLFDLHLILIENSGSYLDLVPQDVRLHTLGCDRVTKAMARLAILLRKLRPTVIMSSMGHLNLALLLIRPFLSKRTRVLVRESNMPSMSFASGAKFTFFRLLYPLLYPSADCIVCPGKAIKNELKRKFRINENKMVVIVNPVLVDDIRSKMLSNQNLLGEGSTHLVASGSLTRQKGFDLLITAMKKLWEIRTDVHLTIIGEGPEKNSLRDQIVALHLENVVTLGGFQANPYPFFHYADLFVLSSRWEGLPNVVLESLACGTPVIAFNCPGSVSEIFDDPSQGALVPPEDIEALVKAIYQHIEMGKSSRKDSLLPKRYEAELVIEQYKRVLTE